MAADAPSLLTVNDLTIEAPGLFGERRIGLRQVSLSFAPGEIAVLAGETDSGKSLLARLATGTADPRTKVLSGLIELEGISLARMKRHRLLGLRRGPVTLVASETLAPTDSDRTVRQWLRSLRRLAKGKGREWNDCCFSAGLLEPDSLLPRRLAELPPLDRKRLGAVRALLLGSRLLVSEEAGADLDPLAETAWHELLVRLRNEFGIGILVTTTSLRGVERFADHVAIFFEGGILEQGTPAEIVASPRFAYTREFRACDPSLADTPGDLHAISREAIREAEEAVHRPASVQVKTPLR